MRGVGSDNACFERIVGPRESINGYERADFAVTEVVENMPCSDQNSGRYLETRADCVLSCVEDPPEVTRDVVIGIDAAESSLCGHRAPWG